MTLPPCLPPPPPPPPPPLRRGIGGCGGAGVAPIALRNNARTPREGVSGCDTKYDEDAVEGDDAYEADTCVPECCFNSLDADAADTVAALERSVFGDDVDIVFVVTI